MPIRQGSILASRASTWPRDHFCRSTMAPRASWPHDVERVLADIDADHGDRGIWCLRHGVLLVFGAPCQLRLLARQEHGRTIPLADLVPRNPLIVRLIATTYERRLARVQIFLARLQGASGFATEIAAIKPSDTALWRVEYFAGMKLKRLGAYVSMIEAFFPITRLFAANATELPARTPRKIKQVFQFFRDGGHCGWRCDAFVRGNCIFCENCQSTDADQSEYRTSPHVSPLSTF
jgi:hypothetical protein